MHTHAPQGLLSDPNMDPEYLGWLVMVGANKKKYKPPLKMIKSTTTRNSAAKEGRSSTITGRRSEVGEGGLRSPTGRVTGRVAAARRVLMSSTHTQ